MQPDNAPLVTTIKERCRVCYTCVRECPAKAIRIAGQQAEVIPERCIGCGNCVRVCSQKAKKVASDLGRVRELLSNGHRVAAIVAPSFPAQFGDLEYTVLVGMLRRLGFALVNEVGFGADLVAAEYRRLLRENGDHRYIATSCPAVVGFVERYQPEMVGQLAPIVSPMIATARALRERYGDDLRMVFIGPCIAKKGEAASPPVKGEVDAVLTFIELADLFRQEGIEPEAVEPSEFDLPHAGTGALFPITRGMLQAADIDEDLVTGEVIAADGRVEFVEAVREFASGDLDVRLLECLCCDGCIMGPGIDSAEPLFRRRARVSRYVRQRMLKLNRQVWRRDTLQLGRDVDQSRTFVADDQRIGVPSEEEVRQIMARMGKCRPEDELNCGACGYETCREHAIAIYKGLAESEMCLPYSIEELRRTFTELTHSHEQLASTREALRHSEKLASMGQLAAGIAHEVNNPLGTVLMLSNVLLDEAGGDHPLREDLAMIASEAGRCRKIVSGLLQFARKNKVEAETTELGGLIDRAARSVAWPDGIEVRIEDGATNTTAEFDQDQIIQVFSNLTNNALDAMPDGGTLTIRTGADAEWVWFSVADTGSGIAKELRKKVFEPFFTTKRAGQGTGLGLSVTYGIVKMHHGDIRVESNADSQRGPKGTTFTVRLPRVRMSREGAESEK